MREEGGGERETESAKLSVLHLIPQELAVPPASLISASSHLFAEVSISCTQIIPVYKSLAHRRHPQNLH